MVALILINAISSKRSILCSRENALRVATRMFDDRRKPISVIRTGNPFQPYRVSIAPTRHEHVELELVS